MWMEWLFQARKSTTCAPSSPAGDRAYSASNPKSQTPGRFQYLRRGFGNYEQDIMLGHYQEKVPAERRKRLPNKREAPKEDELEHAQNSVWRV